MASIIINSACNLRCPFCFATETRSEEAEQKNNMEEEEFDRYLKFDNNIVTSLCGGEPTLHPQFPEYMEKMFAVRGKYINLLTNGLWNDNAYNYIKTLEFNKAKRIMYLFNILHPSLYTEKQLTLLHRSLSCINPENAFIGFTIYKKDFDYNYIYDFAQKYNIKRIRYSIAAPNITDKNSWNVDPKRDFKDLANLVYQFVTETVKNGFEVNSDCGYLPPCVYTKEQLADLLLIESGVSFKCNSVGDIGKGGNTWRCYGCYSAIQNHIDNFKNVSEMQEFYQKESELLLNIDIFDECKDCEYKKREICNGGCLAYRLIKLLKENKSIQMDYLKNDASFIKLIPVINNNVLKVWDRNQDEKYIYARKKQKMQISLFKNIDEIECVLNKIDGVKNIQDIIEELSDRYDNIEDAKSNIIDIFKSLYFKDCIKMIMKE